MVNMREIAEEYRLSHWAQIMQERKASGMSIKAYCESVGIHFNRYFYWQRKLREAALKESTKQDKTGEVVIVETKTPVKIMAATKTPQEAVVSSMNSAPLPEGWAVCEAAKPESSQNTDPFASRTSLQIEIGNSRITAYKNTDTELLAKVCQVLMSIC